MSFAVWLSIKVYLLFFLCMILMLAGVRAIMNKGNETQEAYLVATYSEPSPASDAKASASFPSAEDNSNPVATTNPRRHVTGVILVDWELKDIDATTNKAAEAHSDNKTNTTSSRKMLWTSFSQVSVPPRHGKRGLGKKLVDGAEKFCVELSKKMAKDLGLEKPLPTTMEILVLNVRPELEGWYSRQGYVTTRKDAPFPAPEIVLPGYDVKGVMMEKTLIE